MNKILTVAKRKLNQLSGLIPFKLPTGMTEFDAWITKFTTTYDMPTQDMNSIKYVVAAAMINSDHVTSHKPMYYFYKIIMASAVKQVAGNVFHDIKLQQQQEAAAAKNAEQK